MNIIYNVEIMATLWENTYRIMVTNNNEEYIATLRAIVSIPQDRADLPPTAPVVEPQLLVLVEDATISSEEIIQFETHLSSILTSKFKNEIPHIFFFYPSPEDMLKKGEAELPVS